MFKKTWIKAVVVLIVLLLSVTVYLGISIWTFSGNNQLVKTDAAVVLGAAAWNDEPSPVLRERINHAIWLYENGYVDKIIFTGGKGTGDKYAESEVAREYAFKNGISRGDILVETKSTITEENLQYANEIASVYGLKTFTIVSDPLHMKRAIVMANNMGMGAYSSPTQTSAYQTLGSKVPFFFRELFYYAGYLISQPFR
ncbi:YdcF family protein [Paenibacillus sambharensis]|uniref:YdcF family protein n=1 Tax=Paenibacillus sambharensis TaxID=1803190 RepID=A0A2W1LZZ0_9BACL|nr:YdcF family protein [Paenibacillus sambharensis]PZD97271.1 YdcF family protein [Paenibacillus sambharensis]